MKAVAILLLLIAIGGVALIYGGGFASFDPTQQGLDAKANITPGMTWTKVIDVAGEPGKFSRILRKTEKIGGQEIEAFRPEPESKFTREKVATAIDEGTVPWGFLVYYNFSQSVAFAVTFDDTGIVTGLHDLTTMADLLQMNDR